MGRGGQLVLEMREPDCVSRIDTVPVVFQYIDPLGCHAGTYADKDGGIHIIIHAE